MLSRPTGVLVVAVYYFLSGAGALAGAILLLILGADATRSPFGIPEIAKYVFVIALFCVAIGAGYVATGWGLWQLRQWAQATAVAVAGLTLLAVVAFIIFVSQFGPSVQWYLVAALFAALSLGVIAYLLTPGVASIFGASATMPFSDSTCPHCGSAGIRTGMTVCPFCRQSLFAAPAPPAYAPAFAHSGGFTVEPTEPPSNLAAGPTRIATPRAGVLGWLVIKAGPDAGRWMDLTDDNAIGRDTRCAIALNDDYVSRQHARVKLESGQFFIYDVGSSGGTFVNGRQVQRLMLYDGAEIRVGNTTLEFKKSAPAH